MSRPATFSNEQVLEAGRVLVSRGASVTGFSLRKLVGGGNPSRLISIWEQSRESETLQAGSDVPAAVADLVENMAEKIRDVVSASLVQVYADLVSVARADLVDLGTAHAAVVADHVEAVRCYESEMESLEDSNAQLLARVHELQFQRTQDVEAVNQARLERAAAVAGLAGSQSLVQTLRELLDASERRRDELQDRPPVVAPGAVASKSKARKPAAVGASLPG